MHVAPSTPRISSWPRTAIGQLRWIWAKDHRLPVRLSAARRPAPHDTRGAPESCAPLPVELVELGAGTPPGRVGKLSGVGRGFHA